MNMVIVTMLPLTCNLVLKSNENLVLEVAYKKMHAQFIFSISDRLCERVCHSCCVGCLPTNWL